MASKAGPRAEGTDGSDFSHRERVAGHYKRSAELKLKIRYSLVPHMFTTFLGFVRLAVVLLGSESLGPIAHWEIVWLISGLFAFLAQSSLEKNKTIYIFSYLIGTVVFGIAPLVYGVMTVYMQIKDDFKDLKPPPTWKNAPMRMAVLVFCFQLHLMGLFHGVRLLRAWRSFATSSKVSKKQS